MAISTHPPGPDPFLSIAESSSSASTFVGGPLASGPQTGALSIPATESALAAEPSQKESGVEKGERCGYEDPYEEWEASYPDGGWEAWLCVLGCLALSCCQMGYGLVWSMLVQDLHQNSHKNVPLSTLQFIAGCTNSSMTAACFCSGRLGDRFGYRPVIAIGAISTFISLVISAFVVSSLPLLFVFQGVFLGLSQGLSFPLYMSAPSSYFLRRRGLATGIATSGAGFGGGISSLIVRAMLPRLGYTHTLLIYACLNGAISFAAWFVAKPRPLPGVAKGGRPTAPKNWLPKGVWKDPAFYSLMATECLGLFGYLTPYYFITPYTELKIPSLNSNGLVPAIPLIIMNLTGGIGRILAGLVADRVGPLNLMFISYFFGGLFALVIWPFASSYAAITVFAVLYGFVSPWFLSLLPMVAAQLFGISGLATITGFGVMMNSPGQLAGASISGVILSSSGSYRPVAFYTGSTLVGAGLILLVARFQREPRILIKY